MWRKVRWVLLGIGVVGIGLGIFLYSYYVIYMGLPAEMQNLAEQAFIAGITIEDNENDFAQMGEKPGDSEEKPNNPVAYPLAYADVKSVTLGADEEYLYCKMEFWGKIPNQPAEIGDDKISGTGIKVNITNSKGEDQEIWMLGFGYLPVLDLPTLNTYYFYGPTGIQEPEDKRFSGRGGDSKIAGGAGTDYVMGALPLAHTGMSLGQEIFFSVSVETASLKYDHATVDVLGGQGKMPALITWKLGTNIFQVENDFYLP